MPLFVFKALTAKALRDFRVFQGLKRRSSSAALQNIRLIRESS
jgi:hypothetical protein